MVDFLFAFFLGMGSDLQIISIEQERAFTKGTTSSLEVE
jgi:hypothetical protein